MSAYRKLGSDDRGVGAVEFALAAPVLISLIWGIFQIALVLWANAGIQNALGEGARTALLYDATTTNHVPSDSTITSAERAGLFGPPDGTYDVKDPVIPTDSKGNPVTGQKILQVTYSRTLNFLFFSGPTITLDHSKTAYTVIST